MENVRFQGKNLSEAITNATVELGIPSSKLEYKVISEGSKGFLGLFNVKPAIIEVVRGGEEKVEAVKMAEKPASKPAKKPVSKPVEKKAEKPVVQEAVETEESLLDITKDYLDELFEAMGVKTECKIKFDEAHNFMDIDLSGDDMGILIGKRGQTLDSLQYLISLFVNKNSENYVKVQLDTENYRERRKKTLENLARNIAYKVKRTRRSVSLEPMNPYERRIIHSALQNDRYVCTKSEGEDPYRKVVIMPKR